MGRLVPKAGPRASLWRGLLKALHRLREMGNDLRARVGLALLNHTKAMSRAHAVDALLAKPVITSTKHGPIRFINHGLGSCKRAERLLHKEPDSLKWIDAMSPGSVFWDIGANVGTLSLYAAARGDLEVWAFEPAGVNFYSLAANCELNGFTDRMHCLQIGFGDNDAIGELLVSQFRPAQSFSFKPKKEHFASLQNALISSVDSFRQRYGLACPHYIKIDVPGLTMGILRGASQTLADPTLRQVQIEVDEHGRTGREVMDLFRQAGLAIVARNRKHGGTVQGDLVFGREHVTS
jgi:FkbM family methyltransferase